MSFDSVPIIAVLVATIGFVYLSIEIGVRLGKRHHRRSAGNLEVSGTEGLHRSDDLHASGAWSSATSYVDSVSVNDC